MPKRGPYRKSTFEISTDVPEIDHGTTSTLPLVHVDELTEDNQDEPYHQETMPKIRKKDEDSHVKPNKSSMTDAVLDQSTSELDVLEVSVENGHKLNINTVDFNVIYNTPFCEENEPTEIDSLLGEIEEQLQKTGDTEFADENEPEASVIADELPEIVPDDIIESETDPEKQKSSASTECDAPLFSGSNRRIGFAILLLCCLSIRFKWSDECFGYVISAFCMSLPPGHKMVRSIYTLKEHLKKFVCFPTIHHLCSFCGTHVQKGAKTCTNRHCVRDLTLPGAVGYFIQHSVINQLQLMCKRESFLKKIRTNRFQHFSNNPEENLRDVYDGSNYKRLFNNGFLNDPNAVSFSFNTDGVPIFKSSALSMWPVFMIINELPISERKLKENVIYYGLWICVKKPNMWSYLKPLQEEFSKLEAGVQVTDHLGQYFQLSGTLLNCVCDLPARCMVSNSIQFNGKFGCWFCLQPGETYTTSKGGHVHIYPYQENDPKGPSRSVENLEEDLNQAISNIQDGKKDFAVRGVKGPFRFMFLKHFDVIHGFVIDYMHGICAGVMKMLLTLWFGKSMKNEVFSLFRHTSVVNCRLESIKPNLHITRPPRTLDELCHWKSAEFRNFLFLWSIPVLHDLLQREYFLHFSLLVRGIYILSKENITTDELKNAESCLFKFVQLLPTFYSQRYLTMNCHQLVHICDSVKANGPLFVNNCFVFEDLNGYILKHVHGTTGVEMQIINAITKMQALPALQELYVEKDSEEEALINDIMKPNFINDRQCVEDGIFLLGPTCDKTLDDNEFISVSEKGGADVHVIEYRKIYITKLSAAVYGTAYKRLLKRNQSIIKFRNDQNEIKFGSVKTFIQCEDVTESVLNIALVHQLSIEDYCPQQPAHKVKSDDVESCEVLAIAVPLKSIQKVCNIVNSVNGTFVAEFPNKYEKD